MAEMSQSNVPLVPEAVVEVRYSRTYLVMHDDQRTHVRLKHCDTHDEGQSWMQFVFCAAASEVRLVGNTNRDPFAVVAALQKKKKYIALLLHL